MKDNKIFYILSIATGLCVSTIYLSQPLLQTLGTTFNTTAGNIGLVASATQIGYAFGLFFLIPLGDVIPKKTLILTKQVLLVVALLLAALSTHWITMLIASMFIGLLASVGQDYVSFGADLAHNSNRGKVIGMIMSGLFMGILCSRTFSGIISDIGGWRSVFILFAALVFILSLIIHYQVPKKEALGKTAYIDLIKSLVHHFKTKEKLRTSLFTQGFLGLTFSAFWTNLSFYLGGTFHLSTTQIGLFGVAGAAGVLIAPVAGKMADKDGPYKGINVGAFLVVGSFIAMFLVPSSLIMIILATIIFDLGLQICLVSHQSIIFSLDEEARSRINAIFMTGLFTFFALGSLISVRLYQSNGWRAVMLLGIVSSSIGLILSKRASKRFQ